MSQTITRWLLTTTPLDTLKTFCLDVWWGNIGDCGDGGGCRHGCLRIIVSGCVTFGIDVCVYSCRKYVSVQFGYNLCKYIESRLRTGRTESICSVELPWSYCGFYTKLVRVVAEELKKRGIQSDALEKAEQLHCSLRSVICRIFLENDTKNVLCLKGIDWSDHEPSN